MRKMPPDYRWFSSSCGIPLPMFATTGATARSGVGGGGVGGKYYMLMARIHIEHDYANRKEVEESFAGFKVTMDSLEQTIGTKYPFDRNSFASIDGELVVFRRCHSLRTTK